MWFLLTVSGVEATGQPASFFSSASNLQSSVSSQIFARAQNLSAWSATSLVSLLQLRNCQYLGPKTFSLSFPAHSSTFSLSSRLKRPGVYFKSYENFHLPRAVLASSFRSAVVSHVRMILLLNASEKRRRDADELALPADVRP